MKVDSNKIICPDFGRNILDGLRDDHDDLPLVDLSMNVPQLHLQDMPCLIRLLIRLERIIQLIESACPSLLLLTLDPLHCKKFEALSDINVRIEAIICGECPPLRKITYHLQIILGTETESYIYRE